MELDLVFAGRIVQCPVVSFGVSRGFIWLWRACLLLCAVLCSCFAGGLVRHLALVIAGSWIKLELVYIWRPLDEFSSINIPWDLHSLKVQILEVESLVSGFSLNLYVA